MFSSSDKVGPTAPALSQKAVGTTFFRKTGEESFFGSKEPAYFFGKPLQAKLTVSAPDDPQEKEADAMAEQVMSMPETPATAEKEEEKLQKKDDGQELEEVQAKAATYFAPEPASKAQGVVVQRSTEAEGSAPIRSSEEGSSPYMVDRKPLSLYSSNILRQSSRGPPQPSPSLSFEQALRSSKGSGSALPSSTRLFMESRFGADFSGVRIHTDDRAAALSSSIGAQAFAHGGDVYFNQGRYAPEGRAGKTLLAHELTHTIQQGASKNIAASRNKGAPANNKPGVQKKNRNATDSSPPFATPGTNVSETISSVTIQRAGYRQGAPVDRSDTRQEAVPASVPPPAKMEQCKAGTHSGSGIHPTPVSAPLAPVQGVAGAATLSAKEEPQAEERPDFLPSPTLHHPEPVADPSEAQALKTAPPADSYLPETKKAPQNTGQADGGVRNADSVPRTPYSYQNPSGPEAEKSNIPDHAAIGPAISLPEPTSTLYSSPALNTEKDLQTPIRAGPLPGGADFLAGEPGSNIADFPQPEAGVQNDRLPPEATANGEIALQPNLEFAGAQNETPAGQMPEPQSSLSPPAAETLIQRSEGEDEGGGLFEGIRRRLSGVVDGLRAGWSSLSGMALSAFEGLRSQFAGITQGLGSLVQTAVSGIQSGWALLSRLASQLTNGVKQLLQGAVGTIMGAAQAIAQSIMRMDAAGLQAAFGRLNGLVGGVFQRLQQAGQAVLERIMGVWNGLQGRFSTLASGLTERASQIAGQLQTAAAAMRTRLTSVWEALQNRASQMSGIVGGVLSALQSLVNRLLAWGQQIWNGIRQQASALWSRLESFTQGIRQQFASLWQRLRQQAEAVWNGLTALWNRLRQWVVQQVQQLVQGVRSFWSSLSALSISDLVEKITGFSQLFRAARMLMTGLRGIIEPLAGRITDRVYAAMPGPALNFAQQQLSRAGGTPAPAGPRTAAPEAGTAQEITVHRQVAAPAAPERTTTSWSEIGDKWWLAIRSMWQQLNRAAFLEMVLHVLLEQVFPVIAVARELWAFFTEDIPTIVRGLFMPRNIFKHPLDALHDIYTNLLHLFGDFILSLLRRIVNILMAFMLWITVILTIIGAVGGSVAVGVLGGILGFFAGFGVGAGPGAAAGATAGGAAGAGVGFGVAALVNEAIFLAFLAVNFVTVLELLLDLSTALQTEEEKLRDYKQLAESSVAVGVGIALLAIGKFLAWIAGPVARGVSAFLKLIGIELPAMPAWLARFLRGIGLVRRPKPGEPPVSETGPALAAEQRLARLVGGDLARRLVAELGPEVAERLVAQLGASNVSRLGAELGPRAIAEIAGSLDRAVVERLLDGRMSPSRISLAVAAGGAERLAGLSTEQITRLAGLSDTGFNRIIRLPEIQFQRFINLGDAQLRVFADMSQAAFDRFAALNDATFARFGTMAPERIRVFANLSTDAFNRFAALDPASFAKFDRFNAEALARFGGLTDPAFARFAALPQPTLEKFAAISAPALERFGTMDPARFNLFAQAEQATIEKFAAISDVAFNRFGSVNYTVEQLNKLGRLDPAVLENLAAIPTPGNFNFVTRVLSESTLANIGQLTGAEIDSLVTRLRTNPARLNTIGSLNVAEIRTFMAIGDDARLQRYAGLTPAEIGAFRTLSTTELERFGQVATADLSKFAGLGNPSALQRFATLTPEQVARFGSLSAPQLNEWANVRLPTLNRFGGKDALTLAKLADGAGAAGLDRLAGLPPRFVEEFSLLDASAMQRYLRLPPNQLAKFENMTGFNMLQLARRPAGELEALAATRSAAELLAEAGDTAADRAANSAAVSALDNPAVNPATGRPRGHASDHRAGTDQPGLGGGVSAVERRLRTGVTPGGVPGPRPPMGDPISVFASDAAQLEATRLGRLELQRQINAGNTIGTGPNGRLPEMRLQLEGAGYSYRIVGAAADPLTNNLVGGTMVRQQVSTFLIVFEPHTLTPPPATIGDYFIVTMFPE